MVNNWLKTKLFSINGYMLVGVILVLIITMPFLYKIIMDTYRDSVFEQFETHIREEAGLLNDVLSMRKHSDHQGIQRIIDSVLLKGSTTYIDIVDQLGNRLFVASIDETVKVKPVEDREVSSHDDGTYYLFLPLRFMQSTEIHTLRVGFDESALNDEYNLLRTRVFMTLTLYTLGLILLIATTTRLILKPLRELRQQSRFVANGEINVPLDISTRLRDIKYLSNDLEFMRISLVDMAERMQHKATHDDLTGLPNRFLFNDRLKSAISFAQREGKSFAVLLIDLDRFKEINDTLGHGIGDEILKAIAVRMSEQIRESDTFARIGGDEFSIVLIGAGQIIAEKLASKLIDTIEPPIRIGNHTLKVGASIGISIFPQDGHSSELLMQKADIAMYSSKHNNLRFSCYHHDMDRDSYENLILTNDMRAAIESGQFRPLFQPKIDLRTGTPCGCEILLRWHHPDIGLIDPDKFIPLAEQENLIGMLTRWMVDKYLIRLNALHDSGLDFHVSINVSPNDLLDNSLYDAIAEIIKKTGYDANKLFIEVTENAIMKNPIRSADILNRFNHAGIRVSVDDFGTGYSSLSYLQKFPISELKIDKSFIFNLTEDSNNYPIVNATITMAHDLGISVVAEGVEDEVSLKLLESLNCDHAQGFLFSEPMEFSVFENWMRERLAEPLADDDAPAST